MKEIEFMTRAIKLAKKGQLYTQPNPMVGCVITKNNEIIGEGWHQSYGSDHAEVHAIKNCKRKFGIKKAAKLLKGSQLFVNLEPCSIEKNTPPCVNALILNGITKVICGTTDPNPKINGRGIKALKKAGIETSVGMLRNECEELNRVFFTTQKKLRPYIILKSAQSIDGRIALKNGQSNWISGNKSREDTHKMRAKVQGILIGKNTAELDDPSLTVRLSRHALGLKKDSPLPQPAKIILGNLLTSSKSKKIFSKNARVIIGSQKSTGKKKNVEYLHYKNKDFLQAFMQDLLAKNISSILVEGGQETLNAFIDKNIFDELVLYTAPIILGKDSLNTIKLKSPVSILKAKNLTLIKVEIFENDIKATYHNKMS